MTFTPIPDGEIATIVTWLEMREALGRPVPSSPLSLRRIERPRPDEYRALFRLIGARWLWFSRLIMDDDTLAEVVQHPDVEVHVVIDGGRDAGMVELDFRTAGECELKFIGLVPELAGRGHGRWLLAETVRLAWRDGVERVHVHTCSLDHPAALAAYLRAGFLPVKRAIECFPDPRLAGILPLDCAPQVPVLGTVTSIDSTPES